MKKLYILIICVLAGIAAKPQNTNNEGPDKSIILEASYISDNVSNLSGGIRTGHAYLGMANFHISFDAEKANLWKGGLFHFNAVNTHGSTPSADMLGDMQVASNIEAGNHSYLQEAWFKQTLGKTEFTIGLQDLNVEFANSEHGALFLNSSFGILPTISGNISAPIFPLTSLGFTAKWNISKKTSWLNAIYDGCPTDFDYNPYNIKWEFISGDGILAITEFQYNVEIKNYPGTYKIGLYTHNHLIESKFKENFPDSLNHSTFGAYIYADQKIWEHAEKTLGLFLQAGYSPSNTSINSLYIGGGLNLTGMFSKAKNDVLGLAVAFVNLNQNLGNEACIELTWKREVVKDIFIQPDIQYIIHPSGENSNLNNCLAGILRIGLAF